MKLQHWADVSAIRLAVPPKCITCLLCALFMHLEINLIWFDLMVIRNYHWLNSASRVLISTCSAPLVQTEERKQTHKWTDGHYETYYLPCNKIFHCLTLTFDLWPLSTIPGYPGRPSCQKSRSNGSNRRVPTDKRTDTHTDATKCIISLLRGR